MGEENSSIVSTPPRIASTEAAIANRRQPANQIFRGATARARPVVDASRDATIEARFVECDGESSADTGLAAGRGTPDSGTTLSSLASSACLINVSADHLPPGSSDGPSFQIAAISR